MKEATYKALIELLLAAEAAVPVFDGMTPQAWATLNAGNRRDRIQKAVRDMRAILKEEGPLEKEFNPGAPLVHHDGGFY